MPYDKSTKSRKYPMSGGNTGKTYSGSGKASSSHAVFGHITGNMGRMNVKTYSGGMMKSSGMKKDNYGAANGYD